MISYGGGDGRGLISLPCFLEGKGRVIAMPP